MADSSPVGILSNIFTAPSKAYPYIKERPNPWLPLLVLMFGYAAVGFVYLQVVDLPWMLERQLSQGGNLTEAQLDQAVEGALQISPTVYGVIGAVTSPLGFLLILALISLYYTAVSFASNDGVKYGQWFALNAWCALPAVLGLIASLVNLLINDARFLPQEQINPLSFGSLLAIDGEGAPIVQRILLGLDPATVWSTVLMILGYQAFTQRSVVRATVVVMGPLALIVLVSSLFAFF
jgi:hypothetical protein